MKILNSLNKLLSNTDLSRQDVIETFEEIISGECSDVRIGSWLVALRMKGETSTEIAACIEIMKRKVISVACANKNAIDIVGTGGDNIGTYNISTGSAFVASAAGATVAKHGNRSLSSKSGSADILSELGIRLDLSVEEMGQCLEEVGMSFLFAPLLHPAMKSVLEARQQLKVRTVFNLLGPMVNPVGVRRGVVGVYDLHYCKLLAEAACQLGVDKMLFVYGDGLDEFSVSGVNSVYEVTNGKIKNYDLDCVDVGLNRYPIEQLLGGSPKENKQALLDVLNGVDNAHRQILIFNAGAGLYTANLAISIKDGCKLAREAIDSGKALAKLQALQEFMKKPSNAC